MNRSTGQAMSFTEWNLKIWFWFVHRLSEYKSAHLFCLTQVHWTGVRPSRQSSLDKIRRLNGQVTSIKSISYFIFISTIRPADHTNPSRKRSVNWRILKCQLCISVRSFSKTMMSLLSCDFPDGILLNLRLFHWNRTCTQFFVKLCLLIIYIIET